MFAYIGSYTKAPAGPGEGISIFQFDPQTGDLSLVETTDAITNPAYLALDSSEDLLYAANELEEGGVSAFARNPKTGSLRFLNRQPSCGSAPCYISLSHAGRHLLVANYSSATVAALPIAADGSLEPATCVIQHEGSSIHPERQKGPNAHMILPTPDGRFVLATDLGIDKVLVYRLDDETGKLHPNDLGPVSANMALGDGPRHFVFAPSGRRLYVINELSSTISAFDYDPGTGSLQPGQVVSTLPADFRAESTCAQILLSPDGKFLYGSNRGHDSIAIFAVDQVSGKLTLVGFESTRGKKPRNFAIDPTGNWLLAANQDSGTVVTFRREPETGKLSAIGQVTEIPAPVIIVFSQR